MKLIFFALIIIFALLAIQTQTLRRSIIYTCVFSLLSSFIYLLYMAPDVAIAEAIIGSSISTILFLVALNKYKFFRIYITKKEASTCSEELYDALMYSLKRFATTEELELDIIYTSHEIQEILKFDSYDVIIEQSKDKLIIYGDLSNYHFENMQHFFHEKIHYDIDYKEVPVEVGENL